MMSVFGWGMPKSDQMWWGKGLSRMALGLFSEPKVIHGQPLKAQIIYGWPLALRSKERIPNQRSGTDLVYTIFSKSTVAIVSAVEFVCGLAACLWLQHWRRGKNEEEKFKIWWREGDVEKSGICLASHFGQFFQKIAISREPLVRFGWNFDSKVIFDLQGYLKGNIKALKPTVDDLVVAQKT